MLGLWGGVPASGRPGRYTEIPLYLSVPARGGPAGPWTYHAMPFLSLTWCVHAACTPHCPWCYDDQSCQFQLAWVAPPPALKGNHGQHL